jgi:hypothetical protein
VPRCLNGKQLREAFSSLFGNAIQEVFIPLDISDYPIGQAYIAFNDLNKRKEVLDLEENKNSVSLIVSDIRNIHMVHKINGRSMKIRKKMLKKVKNKFELFHCSN